MLAERLQIIAVEEKLLVASVRDHVVHDGGSGHNPAICAHLAKRMMSEALIADLSPGVSV